MKTYTVKIAVLLIVLLSLEACTYLKYSNKQSQYARQQKLDPSQSNLRRMIDQQNFAIIGSTVDSLSLYAPPVETMAVVAFSDQFKKSEQVDVMHDVTSGTYFGLDLPEGEYELIVMSDFDVNGVYSSQEAIGRLSISVSEEKNPEKVIQGVEISLVEKFSLDFPVSIDVVKSGNEKKSFFYPAGTIRNLEDPIFSPEMSTLGLYDPSAFFDQAPTLFYALEEDIAYKIPVVFVHGISGSAREFTTLVSKMDRNKYKPWFFHYPSGADLQQMAEVFHKIFLDGKLIPSEEEIPLVVVAHSMGGLIVREALNLTDETAERKILFVSLASLYGGHPAASMLDNVSGMVMPSWKNLNPNSDFMTDLFRRKLPKNIEHRLYYAFDNGTGIAIGENSDGVVPLSSQLHPSAQQQAAFQFGFNATHTSILVEEEPVATVIKDIESIDSKIPEDHTMHILKGGFTPKSAKDLSDKDLFYLKTYGCYMEALVSERLQVIGPIQKIAVSMMKGEVPAVYDFASTWQKFVKYEKNNLKDTVSICH
ncbi:MAG: hypothetical protein ACRBCS_08510 [Cellvibrionaceae bacterium]